MSTFATNLKINEKKFAFYCQYENFFLFRFGLKSNAGVKCAARSFLILPSVPSMPGVSLDSRPIEFSPINKIR